MGFQAIIMVLLVTMCWGISFVFIKIGLEELPPILFSALRFSIVALPAIFFIPFPKGHLKNILGVGLFLGIIQYGLVFIALNGHISAGIAALLLQAQVFFTIVMSYLIFRERLSKWQIIGIVISIFGVSLFFKSVSGNATVFGIALCLLAAFSWSVANLIMKTLKSINLLQFMVWSCAVAPLPLFVLSYITETQEPVQLILSTTSAAWFALAFLSYISTLVAFAIWAYLLRVYSAVSVTQFAFLIPVFAMVSASLILGEHLFAIELFASSLVILGLAVCVFEKKIGKIF